MGRIIRLTKENERRLTLINKDMNTAISELFTNRLSIEQKKEVKDIVSGIIYDMKN